VSTGDTREEAVRMALTQSEGAIAIAYSSTNLRPITSLSPPCHPHSGIVVCDAFQAEAQRLIVAGDGEHISLLEDQLSEGCR